MEAVTGPTGRMTPHPIHPRLGAGRKREDGGFLAGLSWSLFKHLVRLMKPFDCAHCEKRIDPDPVWQVDCPTCEAEAGEKCRRPSGHPVWNPKWDGLPKGVHPERDLRALDEGAYGSCPLDRCPESLEELDRNQTERTVEAGENRSSESQPEESQLGLFGKD